MTTNMQQTSLDAYHGSAQNNIGAKQTAVLAAISVMGIATDKEIAKHLGWEINCVTGRRNELVKMDKIQAAGKKLNDAGRSVMAWEVKPKSE